MTHLYDLPRMSPLRVTADGVVRNATFHHIDGSYSYCTLDDYDEVDMHGNAHTGAFHLYCMQQMKLVDRRWELETDDET